jgi:hypothetical protein
MWAGSSSTVSASGGGQASSTEMVEMCSSRLARPWQQSRSTSSVPTTLAGRRRS